MRTVISLCDLTGNMVQPWIEAGYNAIRRQLHKKDMPVDRWRVRDAAAS